MKAGIITICDTENMGNRLQNYALQTILSRYADTVLTIRNKPKLESAAANLRQRSALADSALLNRALGKKRKAKLLEFNRSYIHSSSHCYWCNDPGERILPRDQCDIYCAGSDQIWNPHFYRSDMFNYLGFSDRNSTFSYAASFGVDEIPSHFIDAVRSGLSHLKYISVREESGKQIVEALTGRTDVQVLVDPTMLLTAEEWTAILRPPVSPLPERYQVMYFLGSLSEARKNAIYHHAQQMGCEIIDLMDPSSPLHIIGPDEFLYAISHSCGVYTDSFHGSVFSFLFRRPLFVFDRLASDGTHAGMGSRLETFSETFRLQSCIAHGDQLPDASQAMDYSAGLQILDAERSKAFLFLDQVFSHQAAGVKNQ